MFAQSEWEIYTSADFIWSLAESNEYIYASTSGGFVEINKSDNTVKIMTKKDFPLFASNSISGLNLDSEGNLWGANGFGDLLKYDGETWTQVNLDFPDVYFKGINGLTIDNQDNKWFGAGEYICKFDGNEVTYKQILTPFEPYAIFPQKIFFDDSNNVWFHNWTNGYIYVLEKGNMNLLKGAISTFCCSQDSNGDLWILKNNKIKKFSPTENISVLKHFDPTDPNNSHPEEVSNDIVYTDSIIPPNGQVINFFDIDINNNQIYVGFENDKIAIYKNNSWNYIASQASNTTKGNIQKMFFTSDNSMWASILDYNNDGLSRLKIAKYKDNQWTNMNNQLSNSGLHNNYIGYMACDENNRKWVVSWTTEKYLTFFDGNVWTDIDSSSVNTLNSMFNIKYNADSLKIWYDQSIVISYEPLTKYFAVFDNRKEQSSRIKVDASGNLWLGTTKGLFKFDGNNWETIIADNNIRGLCFDKKGVIYANNLPFDKKGVIFKVENSVVDTFFIGDTTNYWASSIVTDKNNDVWFGTLSRMGVGFEYGEGLWHYNSQTQTFNNYNINNSPIPCNSVVYVTTDAYNNIRLGTYYYGLVMLKNENWTIYNSQNSLLSGNNVERLLFDKEGDLWISCQNVGINVIPHSLISITEKTRKTSSNEVNIYPNPSSDKQITVEFDIQKKEKVSFEIYDVAGKVIVSIPEKNYETGKLFKEIKLPQNTKNGTYFLLVKIGQEVVARKIILN